jgi:hypothetical protein
MKKFSKTNGLMVGVLQLTVMFYSWPIPARSQLHQGQGGLTTGLKRQ